MVLVVEDDDAVRHFVHNVLEGAGYRVTEASGSMEALEILQQTQPALLLTDIVMPVMDGLQLAANAHRLWPQLHVMFITGFADRYQEELTGSVCLSKPFTPAALLSSVESVIGLPSHSTH